MKNCKWEPCVTASEIGVSAVTNGVVTLTGTVAAYAEKWAVERAAQRVEGVKGLAEEIAVEGRPRHPRQERRGDRRGEPSRALKSHSLGAERHPGHRGARVGAH